MILYYPVIVAPSVSQSIVPGLVKAIERFLLLYRLNDITDQLSDGLDQWDVTSVSTQGGVITVNTPNPIGMKESQEFRHGLLLEQGGTKGQFDPSKVSTKVDLKTADLKSISLEPTYTLVELAGPGGKVTKMLGIKALPIRATGSEDSLMAMLQYDRYASRLTTKALNIGRAAVKKLVRAWARVPFTTKIRDIEPSGNVRSDVLLSKTTFATQKRSNIFVVLNKIDLSENFMSPKGIRKLQKLGWENFILTDDVNKVAYFCMRVLRGMCSEIPFSMLYQTLQQRESYETLEDIRKTSSSIFKRRVTFPKAIGESKMRVIDNYLENLQMESDLQILNEGISQFIQRIKPEKFKKFIKEIRPAIREKNIEKVADGLKKLNLPPVSESTLDKMLFKAGPQFRKVYKISEKVLSNTFQDANPTVIKCASYMVTAKVMREKAEDIMKATKEALKSFVRAVRKAAPKMKAPKEYALELAIGWVVVMICITSIGGLLGIAAAVAIPAIQALGRGAWELLKQGDIAGAGETFATIWNTKEAIIVAIVIAVLFIITVFLADKFKGKEEGAPA